MGNRANIHVLDSEIGDSVYLYTHWCGSFLPTVLQDALRRGRDRWNDAEYLARIIFCEMVQHDVMGTRGYGISSLIRDGDHRVLTVCPDLQVVKIIAKGKTWTFEEFIDLNMSTVPIW